MTGVRVGCLGRSNDAKPLLLLLLLLLLPLLLLLLLRMLVR